MGDWLSEHERLANSEHIAKVLMSRSLLSAHRSICIGVNIGSKHLTWTVYDDSSKLQSRGLWIRRYIAATMDRQSCFVKRSLPGGETCATATCHCIPRLLRLAFRPGTLASGCVCIGRFFAQIVQDNGATDTSSYAADTLAPIPA